MSIIEKAHIRIARPTGNLPEVLRFYRDGLGFDLIGSFEDHDGFDGVMLGHHNLPYHLEFTNHRGHKAQAAPSKENLLVFYLPERNDWEPAVQRVIRHGYQPVTSCNPYWESRGKTFEDIDEYRIVLQNAAWR